MSNFHARATTFLAGASSGQLVTPVGVEMAGYSERHGVSTGVHDALEIGALAFTDGVDVCVLASVDIEAVDAELVAAVAEAAGLQRESLALSASHTHSGPSGIFVLEPGRPFDARARAGLVRTMAATIQQAIANLQPATLTVSRKEARGVAANRQDPDRPVDHRVSALRIESLTGNPIAWVLHFACHPTVLGPGNLLISADFPGSFRSATRANLRQDVPFLFLNGASGDVSTRFTRQAQDFGEVERVGSILSAAIPEREREMTVATTPIRTSSRLVSLPAKGVLPIDAANSRVASARAELIALEDAPSPNPAELRRAATKLQGAQAELARAQGVGLTAHPVMISLLQVGSLVIVGVSAEIPASLGAAIEAGSPFEHTLVVGLANGYCGYIVDPDTTATATYELLSSPFEASASAVLLKQVVVLLERLKQDDGI